jgi:hypothetical protein
LALLLLSLAVVTSAAQATEIAGKWGFGFAVGDLLDTRAEGSILRGLSPSRALVIDLGIQGSTTEFERTDVPDSTYSRTGRRNSASIVAGPRLRRFTRPSETLSPYWDLYAHGRFNHSGDDYYDNAFDYDAWGFDIGLDVGAEYFLTRWPVSAAVHTTFLQGSYLHAQLNRGFGTETDDSFAGAIRIEPMLQLRAYF